MTQPEYVPIAGADRVRDSEQMPPPERFHATRPAEIRRGVQPRGAAFGQPGPNLGYGLKLAGRFKDRLRVERDEILDDVVAGCFAVGTKRASFFSRAPTIYDFEHAYALWGFLDGAPRELVEFRRSLFQGASHHYWDQRAIADRVPDETLRLSPAQVKERLADWRRLLTTEAPRPAGGTGDLPSPPVG